MDLQMKTLYAFVNNEHFALWVAEQVQMRRQVSIQDYLREVGTPRITFAYEVPGEHYVSVDEATCITVRSDMERAMYANVVRLNSCDEQTLDVAHNVEELTKDETTSPSLFTQLKQWASGVASALMRPTVAAERSVL
jgi:hypothetical protein